VATTRQRGYSARCPQCGADPALCARCGTPATGSTQFSDWLRSDACPADLSSTFVDCQNLDYIWFFYREGWFITLEEKRYGSSQLDDQADTHQVLRQLLVLGSQTGELVDTWRGKRHIEYRGHYLLVFSETTPDNSTSIWINGIGSTREDLLYLLRLGRLPANSGVFI